VVVLKLGVGVGVEMGVWQQRVEQQASKEKMKLTSLSAFNYNNLYNLTKQLHHY